MNRKPDSSQDLHILVAVDESDRSFPAVDYVGNLLSGNGSVRVTVLNILAPPPEDLFDSEASRADWVTEHRKRAEQHLARCRERLLDAGFTSSQVEQRLVTLPCPSIADCILQTQEELGCGTVVISRRGISKKEEFIFGSTSNRILHRATDCAVWVIESDAPENNS